VQPASLLQPEWRNELPFDRALLDATAERGVLVDAATRDALIAAESAKAAAPGNRGESDGADLAADASGSTDPLRPRSALETATASEPGTEAELAPESRPGDAPDAATAEAPDAGEGPVEAPENP
jgi:hypothetical protein